MYPIPEFEGPFCKLIPEFIRFKRSLGYDYGKQMIYNLIKMNHFLISNQITKVEIPEDLYKKWIQLRVNEAVSTQQKRYTAIHGFADFLLRNGYSGIFDTENPVSKKENYIPYIYSDDEIDRLFRAADHLDFSMERCKFNHQNMFPVLLRLLYSTGMRISEVLNLKLKDIDLCRGCIYIWDSKNHVSRMVATSVSMKDILNRYADSVSFTSLDSYFFHGKNGCSYSYGAVRFVFRWVLLSARVNKRADDNYPRLHDFRHLFSIKALENMEKKGYDLYTAIPLLSRYLGHKSITETEYYIRLTQNSHDRITTASKNYCPNLFPIIGGDPE